MPEELKKYMDELFLSAPKTRAAYELKEELMANSTERYLDLVANQVSEKEALDIVINSIGEIEELFIKEEIPAMEPPASEKRLQKVAGCRAVAVGLYMISFCVMVIVGQVFASWGIGLIAMLITVAIATGILVYTATAYPRYQKTDDTMVEAFKEWNSNQNNMKLVQQSISIILWMVILILYFLISFTTGAWYITWLLFLVGVCAQVVIRLIFQLKDYS